MVSRIKKAVHFDLKGYTDIQDYISECVKYRAGKEINEIMDKNVLHEIASDLTQRSHEMSFSDINAEMRNILSSTYDVARKPKTFRITRDI